MTKKKHSDRSRQDRGPFDGMLDEIIADAEAGAADELASGDGLDGECWVSTLLGLLEGARSVQELPELAAAFRAGLVARLAARPAPVTAGLLRLFDEVAPRPIEASGSDADARADGAAVSLPAWGDPGPVAVPAAAYLFADDVGDQEGLTLLYDTTPQQRAHVVGVLIDHNLGGSLRDVFVSDDVEDCLAELRTLDGDLGAVSTIEPAEALHRLGRALEISRFQPGGAKASGTDVAALAALLRRRAGGVDVRPVASTDAEIDAVAAHVLRNAGLVADTPPWVAGAELLRAWGRHSGIPLRPSPLALALALLDGIATRRWDDAELTALAMAVGRITEAGFRGTEGVARTVDDDGADDLDEALADVWPQARAMLRNGHRLAPTRREVLDELTGAGADDDDDDETWDDDAWDDEGDDSWDDGDSDGAIRALTDGLPVIDLGRRRPHH